VEEFSLRTRERNLERLASESFDLLVVGAGITGAGVAFDAASRGLKVALVEREDFASGTSSRSSRFVHGGLRYLAHGELGLVRESLAERRHLRRMAPHLVRPVLFMLPVPRGAPRRLGASLGAAMVLYDVLGGRRFNGSRARATSRQAHARAPALSPKSLEQAHLYWEATVDDARLTLAVARTAARHGAVVATRCSVIGLDGNDALCEESLGGGKLVLRARCMVNAAGVWSDCVRALQAGGTTIDIRPAKGVHLAVPRALVPGDVALMLPVGGGRFVFTCPWGVVTLIGTTDSDYDGPLEAASPDESEITELLERINPWLEQPLERSDVVGAYAGLRPLPAGEGSTADLSRRHRLSASGPLVTIAGGKLTTWRKMAVETVDYAAQRVLGERIPPTRTTELTLVGAGQSAPDVPARLYERYGAHAVDVLALAHERDLDRPLIEGLPYLEAEVAYAARHELAATVEDVLERRTRASVETHDGGRSAAARIEELLAT
jgi:glycerol-3-phosphate dehydrogenase